MIKVIHTESECDKVRMINGKTCRFPDPIFNNIINFKFKMHPEVSEGINDYSEIKDKLLFEIFNEKSHNEKIEICRQLERMIFSKV